MKSMIRSMLREITKFSIDDTQLSTSINEFNTTVYNFITNLYTTAVLPISAAIISIILVLALARNATHMEGDHQMGVKIIAVTMFKSALLVIAAQNSTMFLNAFNEVSSKIIIGIGKTKTDFGSDADLKTLNDKIIPLVSDLDTGDQAGMIMMLLIPYLTAIIARVVIQVMIFFRFAELYAMSAFASLPIAFLGHPDTENMGVNYLQKYAAVSLQGATLMLAISIYSTLMHSGVVSNGFLKIGDKDKLVDWMFSHYVDFVIPPIVLLILTLTSGKIAKSLVGQ